MRNALLAFVIVLNLASAALNFMIFVALDFEPLFLFNALLGLALVYAILRTRS